MFPNFNGNSSYILESWYTSLIYLTIALNLNAWKHVQRQTMQVFPMTLLHTCIPVCVLSFIWYFLKALHQNIDYFANELSLHQMYDCHIFTLINLRFVCTLKKKGHRSRRFACYIWKHHHCWWKVSKFRHMLAAYGLWAVRDLYSAHLLWHGMRLFN